MKDEYLKDSLEPINGIYLIPKYQKLFTKRRLPVGIIVIVLAMMAGGLVWLFNY